MSGAPTIRTERLVLCPHVMEDWPAYRDVLTSERARAMGGPYDEQYAWFWFASDIAQWSLMGHGALAVRTHAGQLVGQVTINRPPFFPEGELGWIAFEGGGGRGYLTEAAAALRLWAYRSLGWKRLVSYIAPGNLRSIALAERLGAWRDPDAPGLGASLVYRHPGLRALAETRPAFAEVQT